MHPRLVLCAVLVAVPSGIGVAALADPPPAAAPATAPAAAPGGTGATAPLPKAGPRGPAAASKLPPFFGIFGSADLIAKVGFRGKAGSYIEYEALPNSPEAGTGKGLRVAQVAPDVPGARWLEVTGLGTGAEGVGLKVFTKGEAVGNVRRIIVESPQLPPMELPLDSLSSDMPISMPGGDSGDSLLSDAKHLGSEKVTVPIGTFQTEHWLVSSKQGHRLEVWTTKDERVPFTGCVKMLTNLGSVRAVKVGTDAVGTITVPPSKDEGN